MDVKWLGRMAYGPALELQRETHSGVVAGTLADTLLLVEHEPVFTAGRRTKDADRPPSGVPVIEVDRGGEITWHGPGQLTGYPILRLPPLGGSGEREGLVDVVAHVRRMEQLLIDVCLVLGVVTERVEGRSGVWVRRDGRPDAKLGAVGVRVSRGVTMHGFALNANCSLDPYAEFVPCGIRDAGVTSLTEQLGRDVTVNEVLGLVIQRAGLLQGTLVS